MQGTTGTRRWQLEDASHPARVALYAAAGLAFIDAVIHAMATPAHFAEWWGYGAFFLASAGAQTLYAVALVRRPSRGLALLGVAGAVLLVLIHGLSRTIGPLIGPHAGHAEALGGLDVLSKAIEVAGIAALALLYRTLPAAARRTRTAAPSRWAGLLARPGAKLAIGAAAVLLLLAIGYRFGTGLDLGSRGGTISGSDARTCSGSADCHVYLTATLADQRYAERLGIWNEVQNRVRMAQGFVLTVATHSGSVTAVPLKDNVFLRSGGVLYPAVGEPLSVGTHHNTYLVFFPRYDMRGTPLFEGTPQAFDVVVRGVDGAGTERVLGFSSSTAMRQPGAVPLREVLMTVGAAMAALLFACTPCLVGSLMVGSLTSGGAAPAARAKRTAMRQTVFTLAALVVGYLGVAVAVSVFDLRLEALRPLEALAGLVLLVVGVSLLRPFAPFAAVERSVRRVARAALRRPTPANDETSLGNGASSAMGASLAMVCSVAGAPTLSTAVLLPLLVYAGLGHPLWAFSVLLVYLVVCAVPFFLISVGWGQIILKASMRTRRALMLGNALVLLALGVLLVLDQSTVADAVSMPARLMVAPLRWLL